MQRKAPPTEEELLKWWAALTHEAQATILDRMYMNGEEEETIDLAELIWSRWDMGLPLKAVHLQHLKGWEVKEGCPV